jgi:hypothetical protein
MRAPNDLSCSVNEMKFTNMSGPALQLVEGCGKSDVYIKFFGGDWVPLRERAAFDLSCKKENVQVTVLDPLTYGTTGCDRKATYKVDWHHGFVMNSADSAPKTDH